MKTGILLPIVLAILGLAVWVIYGSQYILSSPFNLVNNQNDQVNKLLFIFYGYITMVIGVFLGSIYRKLKEMRSNNQVRVSILKLIRSIFSMIDFWIGIFASPVVYIILLQAVNLEDVSFSGIIGLTLVGLQNGFVCNTIADALINPSQT